MKHCIFSLLLFFSVSTSFSQGTSEDHIVTADNLIRQGKYMDAIVSAQAFIKAEPNNFRGYYYAAFALYKLGDENAATYIKEAKRLGDVANQKDIEELYQAIVGQKEYEGNINEGDEALRKGFLLKAATCYRKAYLARETDFAMGLKAAKLFIEKEIDPILGLSVLQRMRNDPKVPVEILGEVNQLMKLDGVNFAKHTDESTVRGLRERSHSLDRSLFLYYQTKQALVLIDSDKDRALERLKIIASLKIEKLAAFYLVLINEILDNEQEALLWFEEYCSYQDVKLDEILKWLFIAKFKDNKQFLRILDERFGDGSAQKFSNHIAPLYKIISLLTGTWLPAEGKDSDYQVKVLSQHGDVKIDVNRNFEVRVKANLYFKYKKEGYGKSERWILYNEDKNDGNQVKLSEKVNWSLEGYIDELLRFKIGKDSYWLSDTKQQSSYHLFKSSILDLNEIYIGVKVPKLKRVNN